MITTRRARPEDLPALLEIEKSSIKGNYYLEDVYDYFLDNTNGELIVAELDGVPAGFGRFSVLPEHSGWLETLRVHADMQKKGCGAAIWKRYMELCKIFRVKSVAMYTGVSNYASQTLAVRNGVEIACRSHEGNLDMTGAKAPEAPCFRKVTDVNEAAELLAPAADAYEGYFAMNRTWMHHSPLLYRWLCEKGMVYEHEGTVMVLGARFLEKRALHIGLIIGDVSKAAAFAKAECVRRGLPKLTALVPISYEKMEADLAAEGLTFGANTILTMDRIF